VTNPAEVIDRITTALTSGGAVVVVEWAWEKFDEQTAAWCFERLGPNNEEGWLHRCRDEWVASGQEWLTYLHDWAERERLHPGEVVVRLLDERLERQLLTHGPYFFPDLADTTDVEEQAAIDAGESERPGSTGSVPQPRSRDQSRSSAACAVGRSTSEATTSPTVIAGAVLATTTALTQVAEWVRA
jgi:hypothetical protein